MVKPDQRFKRNNPCPICGGNAAGERGTPAHCFGYTSDKPGWANCTRRELAGNLPMNEKDESYHHWLEGPCKCGVTHGFPRPPASATTSNRSYNKMGDFQAKQGKPLVDYLYCDEAGQVLYKVRRYEPKDFKQFHPDPVHPDNWLYGRGNARPVLYKLPDILKRPKDAIFICEGEKDVEALFKLNLLATTNVDGAGHWRDEYNPFMAGRRVVLLPDNDTKGQEHALKVAQAIAPLAKEIKIIQLPGLAPKGDISDWLAAGHTKEELRLIYKATPAWKLPGPGAENENGIPKSFEDANAIISTAALIQMSFPPIRWVVPGLLPEGATLLVSKPKLGKSWLSLSIALAVAGAGSGLALGHLQCEAGAEAFYLALEDNPRRLQSRLKKLQANIGGYFGGADSGLHFATSWPRTNNGGLQLLKEWMELHPLCRLIIVDTIAKLRPARQGQANTNVFESDYNDLSGLKDLADMFHIAVVIVHHSRKGVSEDALEEISGSLGLSASIDNAFVLRRQRGEADAVLVITGRDIEDQEIALSWDAESCKWEYQGAAKEFAVSKERQEIWKLLELHPEGLSCKAITDALGTNFKVTFMTLTRMYQAGQLELKDKLYFIGMMGKGGV